MVDSNQFVTDLTTIGGGTAHMIGYAQNAGAGYIEAPNNTQQADGVVPLDRLPAQWWNWFLNQATRRFSEYETYVENIVAELDGVLDILGITPDAGDPSTVNQLKTMFASHYLQDYLPEVIAAASSFSADATHENHILVADDDGNSGYSVKKVPYAPGFILNTQLSSAAKTLTLPANCPFDGQTIKICFANGHEASNSTDYMTLNVNSTGPVPIVSNQNGTLANLPIHELTAGTYSVLMANVTLEMYYTSNGFNSNPAWVVIGNPVVLSSTDYTIYADGYKATKRVLHIVENVSITADGAGRARLPNTIPITAVGIVILNTATTSPESLHHCSSCYIRYSGDTQWSTDIMITAGGTMGTGVNVTLNHLIVSYWD